MTTNRTTVLSRWNAVLLVAVLLIGLYGFVMVVAPHLVGNRLFGPLGFGLDRVGDVSATELDYVAFLMRVLGAVIVGWMAALAGLVIGPLSRREPWAWWTITGSLVLWFVVDTGMSVAVGEIEHAVFNTAFLVAVTIPLVGYKRALDVSGPV